MKAARGSLLAALLGTLMLASCGGGDTVDPNHLVALQDYEQTRKPLDAGADAAALTPGQSDELLARSRDWAVSTLSPGQALVASNDIVVPPLYFAFVNAVANAAHGDTLTELRAVHAAPSSTTLEAALLRGVQRDVTALAGAQFRLGFLQGIDMPLWRTRSVMDWADTGFKAETQLRVQDSLDSRTPLPAATEFIGTFEHDRGGRQSMAMLRIEAGARRFSGAGFDAVALSVAARRLVRIIPSTAMNGFSPQALRAAIDEAARATAPAFWSGLPAAVLVLPKGGIAAPARPIDTRGMALAFDEVKADLRGMNDGGNYAVAVGGSSFLGWDAAASRSNSSQELLFVYSPRNLYGPGSYGVISTNVNPYSPPCPTPAPDLRPFYWLELDEHNRVLLLARVTDLPGEGCGGVPVPFGGT